MSAGEDRIRLVIVEDEDLYRDLLRTTLSHDALLDVAGAFADAASALEAVPQLRPHVALLDIELGGELNGIQLGLLLRRQMPDLGIVLLSNLGAPRFLAALPPAEIAGWSYLLKRSVPNSGVLRRAIQGAALRLVTLDPLLVSSRNPREGGRLSRLTPRQREILELLAQGLTNDAIADQLALSTRTVENQIGTLYQELGLNRGSLLHPRVKAVLLYLEETHQRGLWEPPGAGTSQPGSTR